MPCKGITTPETPVPQDAEPAFPGHGIQDYGPTVSNEVSPVHRLSMEHFGNYWNIILSRHDSILIVGQMKRLSRRNSPNAGVSSEIWRP
jgi:hypothetical protein